MSRSAAGETRTPPGVTEIDISGLGPKKVRAAWLRQEFALPLLAAAFYLGIMSAVGFPVLGIQLPEFVGLGLAILVALYLLFLLFRLVGRAFGGVHGLETSGGRSALIPHLEVTLGEARSRLRQHFASGGKHRKGTASTAGQAKSTLYTLGALLTGVVAVMVGNIVGHGIGHFFPIVVGSVFGLFVIWLLRRAARHAQPSVASALASDPRPPVLLLRSFVDDSLLVDQRIKMLIDQQATIRFEEAMSAYLSDYGPFVCRRARPISAADRRCPRLFDQGGMAVCRAALDHRGEFHRDGHRRDRMDQVGAEANSRPEPDRRAGLAAASPAIGRRRAEAALGQYRVELRRNAVARALLKVAADRSLALHLRPDGSILAITGKGRLMQDYETASLIVLYSRFCQKRR